MALIDDVKVANRVTTDDSDLVGQLSLLIAAAKLELQRVGVVSERLSDDPDPLIKMAVILYTRAHFGLDNPEREQFAKAFAALENAIRLSDYTTEVSTP